MKKPKRMPPGIRQRADGVFQIRYYDENGNRCCETVHGTLTDAKNLRLQRLHEVRAGTHIKQTDITLQDYLDTWMENRKRDFAPYTRARYEHLIANQILPRLGSLPLTKLTPMRLKTFYADLLEHGSVKGTPLSSTTASQVHRMLSSCLTSAVEDGILSVNPAQRVARSAKPKARRVEIKVLKQAELARLINETRTGPWQHFHIPILLAGVCGLRRGEMLGLRWSDLDVATKTIQISRTLQCVRPRKPAEGEPKARISFKAPKSGKPRGVRIPGFVVDALRQHKVTQAKHRLQIGPGYKDSDLVACRADGSPWASDAFSPRFQTAAKALGFPDLTYHILRHTAITIALSMGIPVKIVQEMAGHHSAAFTLDKYAHVSAAMQEEMAQRLDEAYAGKLA